MQRIFLFIILLIYNLTILAQDTTKTLNAEQVLDIVRQCHPVAKQATIGIEKAKAEHLVARGLFNPIISSYIAKKTFDGTNYYTYQTSEIKIPTWYGLELYSGLENLNGSRFDPT